MLNIYEHEREAVTETFSVKHDDRSSVTKRILQIVGILCICLMFSVIIHKGFNDISALIQKNTGDFWRALVRYFISNLAGGKG
jgi:hypothetical protein